MPQIIVTADRSGDRDGTAVMLRERVSVADFESHHFAAQLMERLGWAVGDAHEVERSARPVVDPTLPANGHVTPEPSDGFTPEPAADAEPAEFVTPAATRA